jgi:hypothetical protein
MRHFRNYRRTLRSTRTARLWTVAFLASLGLLAGVLGFVAALFPSSITTYRWWFLLSVLIVSAVWGTVKAWPRSQYSRHFPVPDTEVSIVVGDLFEQDGHLVIGMSDTFDTETPDIIKARSIQGQLLSREYQGDLARLDNELDCALRNVPVLASETRQAKPHGKRRRHAMGTVAVLGTVPRRYFCVAYSRMSNSNVAQSTVSDLWTSLSNTWQAVREKGQREAVSIPIVGSDLARLSNQLSRADLVRLILLSFLTASREHVVTSHLRIVIYPKDAERMDLRELADFLKAQ